MVFFYCVIRLSPLLLATALTGCTMTVHLPEPPKDPVTVVLVDYGRHSSLVIPRPGGGCVEYGFGEWNWYALEKDRWYHSFAAMLWPTQGTLGRHYFGHKPESPKASWLSWSEANFQIPVERSRAQALLDRLNARFDQHADSRLYNPLYQLDFVHDDNSYCITYSCNHAIASWLEELGCRVTGYRLFADFTIAGK